ncbi:Protein Eyes Shut [Manis pentadactyla]|nr:Protein Eyes Shut [Manis pentadactyla]
MAVTARSEAAMEAWAMERSCEPRTKGPLKPETDVSGTFPCDSSAKSVNAKEVMMEISVKDLKANKEFK